MTEISATPDTAEAYGVRLSPAEFAATRAKIAKINERGAKRGFTGRFEVVGERVERTEVNDLGLAVTEITYITTITGETPKYNGWAFLARVDVLGDSFTTATAPGVDYIDRDLIRAGHCDHCSHNRARKSTFLVQHEDGAIKNVGSTCIKDFLGWTGSFAFISESEVERDVFGISGTGERTYTVETILAAAHAATRAFGWRPASFESGTTADAVRKLIGAVKMTARERAELAPVREHIADAMTQASIVRDWVLSDEFSGQNNYVYNLKAAVAATEVGWKHIGIIASAPQAYTRFLESAADRAAREAQWAAEKAAKAALTAHSAYLGKEKDKVQFKGTISAIRYIDGKFGTTVLYTILTTDGNLVKWFASDEVLGEQTGTEVHLIGTIKELDEYQGTKSTVVTRCAKVNPDTGKTFSARVTNKHYESTDEWNETANRYETAHDAKAHPDCEICYGVAHADEN